MMHLHRLTSTLWSIVLGSLLCLVGGCAVVGVLASNAIPQTEPPKYVGLQNQTVAVMVWADRAVRIDWDKIHLDTSASIMNAMQAAGASKELQGTTYPLQAATIVRFQKDRPYLDTMPVTEFAAELGVSRLIYVELERFTTRSDFSPQMYRGTAIATMKVIEIDAGQSRVAYEENGITGGFPRKGPQEGEVAGNDYAFYVGTVRSLSEEIVKRLVTHESEQ
jgi:hypothetical protein